MIPAEQKRETTHVRSAPRESDPISATTWRSQTGSELWEERDENRAALRRLFRVALWLGLLTLSTYVIPALHAFRPWTPAEGRVPFWAVARLAGLVDEPAADGERAAVRERLVRLARAPSEVDASAKESQVASPAPEVRVFPAYAAPPGESEPPIVTLENAQALDHYFRRLTGVELGEPVIARAAHVGDSALGDDGLSFAIRRRLQARFGDAGHGFHVLAPFNTGYLHRGVRARYGGAWSSRCEILFLCEPDGRYGLGGTSNRSWGNAFARFATARDGFGSRVSRFELWYARMPNGGRARVHVDGTPVLLVQSAGDPEDAREVLELSDGYHELEVEVLGGGQFRGYGVVLERAAPGVVWDGLAVIGAFTARFDAHAAEHIAAQVAQRKTDLFVFLMGGNDVQRENGDLAKTMAPFEAEYTRVLRKYRAGRPKASCLIMSIVDHGVRESSGIRSRPIVARMVESQRRIAFAEGCAFFDTVAAMGGPGAVARWHAERPPWMNGDLAHLTSLGHEVVASVFHGALMDAYANFRRENEGKPLGPVEHEPTPSTLDGEAP